MVFNTGETSEELKAKYNPEGSKLRRLQLRMLDMLIYIDKVCTEQNIDWRLDCGNILGAVRHGGFIPWDDDIDIVLVPKEHKRLVAYLKDHPHPQFVLQDNDTDPGFYAPNWAVLRDLKSEYKQDSHFHNEEGIKNLQLISLIADINNLIKINKQDNKYDILLKKLIEDLKKKKKKAGLITESYKK